MKISDFDYYLPEHLIAQEPLVERQLSRMMIVDRATQSISDRMFADLPGLLAPGDVLVLNNTKVFPARLQGRSDTGANVEVFLIRERNDLVWEALSRPARRLPPGKTIVFSDELSAEVLEKKDDGKIIIRFQTTSRFA